MEHQPSLHSSLLLIGNGYRHDRFVHSLDDMGNGINLNRDFKGALPFLGIIKGSLAMVLGAIGPLGNTRL